MKIDYVSDLHVNHHVPFVKNQLKWEQRTREWVRKLSQNKEADVLVIAGDFSEFNQQSLWVLETFRESYEFVLFVLGNHDYYILSPTQYKKYGDSNGRVHELIRKAAEIPKVLPLNGHIVEIEGKRIAGESMWYFPQNEADWSFYHERSNDSKHIYINSGQYDVSSVDVPPYFLHDKSMTWYKWLEDIPIDLMVSHMPPVHPPTSPHEPNGCYHTKVPFLASDQWICGHQHLKTIFEKAGTTFYMNPIGYPDEKITPTIETITI